MVDWSSNLLWLVLAILLKVGHFIAISYSTYRKTRKDARSKYTVLQQGNADAGKQKIVVTGDSFLARHVVDLLVERFSDFSVTVLAGAPPSHKLHPPVTYIVGDVRVPAHVQSAFAGAVGVIHTEELDGPDASANPITVREVITEGTRHVIEVCLDKEIKSLVYSSTAWVHTTTTPAADGGLIKEDTPPPDPTTLLSQYAAAKRAAERLVLAANGHVVRTLVLRPGWLIGAGDQGLVDSALHSSLAVTASDNKPAFSWVRDAARAHVLALLRLVMPDNQQAAAAAAQPWTCAAAGGLEASEPDPDYVVVAHTDAKVAGRTYHICFDPHQQPPSHATVCGVAAEAGVNAWGTKPRRCLPPVLLPLLLKINTSVARRLGWAPFGEQLTDLHVHIAGRAAALDISAAKNVLGWRPLPWTAVKDAIRAEVAPIASREQKPKAD